jgi:hypothetical protein
MIVGNGKRKNKTNPMGLLYAEWFIKGLQVGE